jgi:hypothetical protein
MKLLVGIFLITFSVSAFGQKASLISLEKLYAPQSSSGEYKAWKNESVLIPFRFESLDIADVDVKFTTKNQVFDVEWFEIFSVWADFSAGHCGQSKAQGTFDRALIPDRAVPLRKAVLSADSTVKWGLVRVNIPKKAKSGSHSFEIKLRQGSKSVILKGKIEVKDRVAARVKEVDFSTDFWQFPISMADYHKIKPWTQAHWEKVDVMFSSLREINQFSVTVPIFWDLYNTRNRPRDEMFVQVIKESNGTYSYNFEVFEKYVQKAIDQGVSKQISIHNLFPWNQTFFYFDQASGEMKSVNAAPGSSTYQAFYKPLILAISEFLETKRWKDRTVWVIDERDANQTMLLKNWVDEFSPGLQFSFAGRMNGSLVEQMDEYALPLNVVLSEEYLATRAHNHTRTLLYTSCYETANQPNILMTSDLRDIYFLAHLVDSKGYQGFLRWAFNLWSSQIKTSAIYSDVPSGDAHLVYPDGELSVRYLVLQDAIEDIGKFRLLSRVKNAAPFRKAMIRYFLINIEKDRFEMVGTMKAFLND